VSFAARVELPVCSLFEDISRHGNSVKTADVICRSRIGELNVASGIGANAEPTPIDQVGRGLKQVKQTGVTGEGQIDRAVGCTGALVKLGAVTAPGC